MLSVRDPLLTPGHRRRKARRASLAGVSLAVPILAAVVLHAGCSRPDPASSGAPSAALPPRASVGPSPLRRLSNHEYLNALHDLFPDLQLTLPALPPDVPVAGFDNAAEAQQPSDVLVARYASIADLYAASAAASDAAVRAYLDCAGDADAACATRFVEQMGSRLFRRPIDGGERDRLVERFRGWQAAVDFEGAVELTLSAMLQSPPFLYRVEPASAGESAGTAVPADAYAMASRLSFFLWESVPDDALLAAASRGELETDDQLHREATRMLADDRARRVLWSFPRQWLGLDRILLDEHAARAPQVDAQWTAATQASAFTETERFVESTLAEGGTLRDLLTSRRAWVDGEMARVYGLPAPLDPTAWTEVTLPESERAGLLTRASFLAAYSHRGATSPPVRGNGIELRLLCQLPLSPPPGVDLSQPTAAPGSGPQTNRMLFEARTAPASCQGCHVALNGFGFGLEGYDAAGHFQTTDDGLPVDARGALRGTDVDGPFDGAIALSQALSRSQVVHDCATRELVRYALGRAPADVEGPMVKALSTAFMQRGGDVRALLLDVVLSPSFRARLVEGAE